MNKLSCLISLLIFVAAIPATKAFESIRIEQTWQPQMPPSLMHRGVSEGKVVVVVAISAEGKLTDHLVVAYTHEALVKPIIEALKEWKYQPASQEGVAVPAQVELTITLTATGMLVASKSGLEMVESFLGRIVGNPFQYRVYRAREIDRIPLLTNALSPKYAEEALKDGLRGKVLVHFYIDEKGATRMPCIEKSAHPYLSEIAVDAVRGWKFEPPTAKGTPVLVEVAQEFDFGGGQ